MAVETRNFRFDHIRPPLVAAICEGFFEGEPAGDGVVAIDNFAGNAKGFAALDDIAARLNRAVRAEFKALVQKRIAKDDPRHTKTEYQIYPEPMFGAYKDRREEHGVQLYGSLGIGRDDTAGRLGQYKKNFEFFDAPVALFITIDRRLGPGQWADLGGYIHALAFLARGHGLDTCPQEAWARLYDTVGDFLKLPPNEMLFCGFAIGYGDRKHKANDFHSPRAELHEFCKFYGFN